MSQMKEKEKSPEKELDVMEASNLPNIRVQNNDYKDAHETY